jgi:hypothetical protein
MERSARLQARNGRPGKSRNEVAGAAMLARTPAVLTAAVTDEAAGVLAGKRVPRQSRYEDTRQHCEPEGSRSGPDDFDRFSENGMARAANGQKKTPPPKRRRLLVSVSGRLKRPPRRS